MKKVIIALVAVAAAACVNAASCSWKLTSMGSYQSKDVYAFNYADQADVLAALAAGGADIATTIETYSLGNGTSSTGSRASVSGNANGVDSNNSIFFVIFDAAIADGEVFAYSTAQNVADNVYNAGEAPKTAFSTAATGSFLAATNMSIGQAVPEPTSGLLLLLGMAGLALKRKQA